MHVVVNSKRPVESFEHLTHNDMVHDQRKIARQSSLHSADEREATCCSASLCTADLVKELQTRVLHSKQ